MGGSPIALVQMALCFTAVISIGAVSLPGAKIRLSQKGLDYAAKKAIENFDIKGQHIPDQHGDAHEHGGKVKYDITGIVVQSFGKPTSRVIVDPGKGITWSATGASTSIHANWHYKFRYHFIKFSDHGSLDVSASGVDFSASFILGKDTNGRPSIKTTSCKSNVGKLKVKFHGGASWLYNLFDHSIAKSLKGKLNELLCRAATKYINEDAEKRLATLDLITDIGHNHEMILDYSLTQAPAFNKGYMDVILKGEFAWKKAPIQPPFQPKQFPETTDASKMLYIWGSDYIVNSFTYAAYSHHLARSNLSREDLPKGNGDFLNTTCTGSVCIGSFLHKVAVKYPNSSISINMGAIEMPYVNITPTGINFHGMGNMTLYARSPVLKKVFLFKIQVIVDMSVTARLEGTTLKGKITTVKPKIKVLNSKVGELSAKFLTWLFQKAADTYIIKELNKLGEKGMIIPNIKDCKYVNPVLKLNQGNLMIAADLNWSPKKEFRLKNPKELVDLNRL